MEAEMDVIRRIFVPDGDGAFIEIGPDSEGFGSIEIRTTDKVSQEWFGKVSIGMTQETARLVAKALLATADELTKTPNQ